MADLCAVEFGYTRVSKILGKESGWHLPKQPRSSIIRAQHAAIRYSYVPTKARLVLKAASNPPKANTHTEAETYLQAGNPPVTL
jgi:hypothetical protein